MDEVLKTKGIRKFIYIGDSLSVGYSQEGIPGNYKGFEWYFEELVGSDRVEYITPEGIGGGFVATPGHVWLEALQQHDFNGKNKNEFTDIVCIGGSNDLSSDISTVSNAIKAFVDYCKIEFPYAEITLITLADGALATECNKRMSSGIQYGCRFVPDLSNMLVNPDDFDSAGHTHLSQNGYKKYSSFVNECILYGRTYYHFQYVDEPVIGDGKYIVDETFNKSDTKPLVQLDYYPQKVEVKIKCDDVNASEILYIKANDIWKDNKSVGTSGSQLTTLFIGNKKYRIPFNMEAGIFTIIDSNGNYRGCGKYSVNSENRTYAIKISMSVVKNEGEDVTIIFDNQSLQIPLAY